MDTPSERLASKILDRLVKEKILAPGDQSKLLTRLSAGKIKAEDWRLAIELAGSKEKKP